MHIYSLILRFHGELIMKVFSAYLFYSSSLFFRAFLCHDKIDKHVCLRVALNNALEEHQIRNVGHSYSLDAPSTKSSKYFFPFRLMAVYLLIICSSYCANYL